MKNIPNRIFLQTGLEDYGETCSDFKDLQTDCITWCADKIYKDDLEYISVDFILAKIEELKNKKYNLTDTDEIYNFNMNSTIINTLKNLIE